jgi:tripartite-type tricarboxylate transporter receptor subunit TctC
MNNWFALVGPAGLPDNVTASISRAMQVALADPAVMQRLSDLGAEPLPNTQPQFVRLIESERKRWGDVIRNANIRVE